MNKVIAVVMGGYSPEYDVSIKSGEVVFSSLNQGKFDVYKVLITRRAWFVETEQGEIPIDRADFSFQKNGQKISFDGVFIAIHGTPAEDGLLPAYFDLLNIPYTSSGHFESALTFNKAECNLLLKNVGVNSPAAYYLAKGESYDAKEIIKLLGLPLFVKPNRSGSSIGVSKVKKIEELPGAIEKAFQEDSQLIIESAVIGTEVACGVSNVFGKVEALAITEIVPKNEFFDYESKYSGLSEEITPARIDPAIEQQIREEAEFIYESLNLNGLARVDYIISENGVPFLIEVNTVPGLSAESILPKQAAFLNITLPELFGRCVEHCLKIVP